MADLSQLVTFKRYCTSMHGADAAQHPLPIIIKCRIYSSFDRHDKLELGSTGSSKVLNLQNQGL